MVSGRWKSALVSQTLDLFQCPLPPAPDSSPCLPINLRVKTRRQTDLYLRGGTKFFPYLRCKFWSLVRDAVQSYPVEAEYVAYEELLGLQGSGYFYFKSKPLEVNEGQQECTG